MMAVIRFRLILLLFMITVVFAQITVLDKTKTAKKDINLSNVTAQTVGTSGTEESRTTAASTLRSTLEAFAKPKKSETIYVKSNTSSTTTTAVSELSSVPVNTIKSKTADHFKYLFMSAIFVDGKLCSTGINIAPNLVLTAASAFSEVENRIKQSNITMRIGTFNATNNIEYIDFLVGWVYFHPFYNTVKPKIYDIAILSLKADVEMKQTINQQRTASLTSKNLDLTDEMVKHKRSCYILSWANEKRVFRKAQVFLLPWMDCRKYFRTMEEFNLVPEFHICAIPRGGQHEQNCVNELGAPLMCNDTLYGFTIHYNPDCREKRPTVFLRVDMHQNFINLAKNCQDQCSTQPG